MINNIKLSICMMVKNEAKNLPRCLDAMNPLIEKTDVELIVVDTGSEDETVEISKKYTDKVFFHLWNNNFSEMRNHTIKYASGEWVLIIDADEVLENPMELYELLTANTTEKYNAIMIQVKNFFNTKDEQRFAYSPMYRVFRRDNDFKYVGTVHNQPKYKPPLLSATHIMLTHYGYMNDDDELMKKKYLRTATILKKELEVNPDNIYYNFQLATSYQMYGEAEKALQQIRLTYKIAQKEASKKAGLIPRYVYGKYVLIAFGNKKHDELISIAQEAIGAYPDYLDISFLLANTYIRKNEMPKAVREFKKFIQLYEKYPKTPLAKDPSVATYYYDVDSLDLARTAIVKWMISSDKLAEAFQEFKKIETLKYKVKAQEGLLLKVQKLKEVEGLYNQVVKNDDDKLLDELMMSLENQAKHLELPRKKEYWRLASSFEGVYGKLNRLRTGMCENPQETSKNILNQFKNKTMPWFYYDIFTVLIEDEKQFIRAAKTLELICLPKELFRLMQESEEFKEKEVHIYNTYTPRANDYAGNRLKMILGHTLLLYRIEKIMGKKYLVTEEDMLTYKDYLQAGMSYVRQKYNVDKLRLYADSIDDQQEKMLVQVSFAVEEIEKNRQINAVRFFREAAKTYPAMIFLLEKHIREQLQLELDIDETTKDVPEEQNRELCNNTFTDKDRQDVPTTLSAQINIIRELIESGRYSEADSLLIEVETQHGNCLELLLLKSNLALMASDKANEQK